MIMILYLFNQSYNLVRIFLSTLYMIHYNLDCLPLNKRMKKFIISYDVRLVTNQFRHVSST